LRRSEPLTARIAVKDLQRKEWLRCESLENWLPQFREAAQLTQAQVGEAAIVI